jgi:hypothetical protein
MLLMLQMLILDVATPLLFWYKHMKSKSDQLSVASPTLAHKTRAAQVQSRILVGLVDADGPRGASIHRSPCSQHQSIVH